MEYVEASTDDLLLQHKEMAIRRWKHNIVERPGLFFRHRSRATGLAQVFDLLKLLLKSCDIWTEFFRQFFQCFDALRVLCNRCNHHVGQTPLSLSILIANELSN